MGTLMVNSALLRELLNAAERTALAHRDAEAECYVLGQLEATTNFVYILVAGHGDEELELLCQQLALDALHRHCELENAHKPVPPVRSERRALSPS